MMSAAILWDSTRSGVNIEPTKSAEGCLVCQAAMRQVGPKPDHLNTATKGAKRLMTNQSFRVPTSEPRDIIEAFNITADGDDALRDLTQNLSIRNIGACGEGFDLPGLNAAEAMVIFNGDMLEIAELNARITAAGGSVEAYLIDHDANYYLALDIQGLFGKEQPSEASDEVALGSTPNLDDIETFEELFDFLERQAEDMDKLAEPVHLQDVEDMYTGAGDA